MSESDSGNSRRDIGAFNTSLRNRGLGNGNGNGNGVNGSRTTRPGASGDRLAAEARQGNGFEAYRRWLTRVQAPGGRRVPLDASLYTWKGYRSWSDQVRRDWKNDD